eukprot:scaffold84404_cov54-Prasinocladus_malaysianus.AAC.1
MRCIQQQVAIRDAPNRKKTRICIKEYLTQYLPLAICKHAAGVGGISRSSGFRCAAQIHASL